MSSSITDNTDDYSTTSTYDQIDSGDHYMRVNNSTLTPSNNPNKFAVNAITGIKYEGIYTQSIESRQLFTVLDATSRAKTVVVNGVKTVVHSSDPDRYYYDSQGEYMRSVKRRCDSADM